MVKGNPMNIDRKTWDEKKEEAQKLNELNLCHGCVEDIDPETCGTAELGGRYEVYICDECSLKAFADIMDSFGHHANDPSVDGLRDRLHDRLDEMDASD